MSNPKPYIDISGYPYLLKCCLEYFIVVDIFVVIFGLPVDLAYFHCPRVDGI
jgi:hypothetical protein